MITEFPENFKNAFDFLRNPIPCIEIAGRYFYRREDLETFIRRGEE